MVGLIILVGRELKGKFESCNVEWASSCSRGNISSSLDNNSSCQWHQCEKEVVLPYFEKY